MEPKNKETIERTIVRLESMLETDETLGVWEKLNIEASIAFLQQALDNEQGEDLTL